jgi:hypothetical protein
MRDQLISMIRGAAASTLAWALFGMLLVAEL